MLEKKDKYRMRGLSNTLKPVVILGKDGLTENTIIAIKEVIKTHELIKISTLKTYTGPDHKELANLICSSINAELIQVVGHVITIYKKNKDINQYGIK